MEVTSVSSSNSANAGAEDRVRVREFYKTPEVAEAYDGERFASTSGRALNMLERAAFMRAVDRATSGLAAAALLDAPCGTGRVTEWLLQGGFHVTAADISAAMIAVAARRCAGFPGGVRFMCADLEHIPVPDNTFDLASCIRLFHHLPPEDRVRILRELARVSRDAVVANVSLSTPYYRLRRRVKRLLHQGISRQSCTSNAIHAEAARAGLRVEALFFVAPYLSEDVVVLFRKAR